MMTSILYISLRPDAAEPPPMVIDQGSSLDVLPAGTKPPETDKVIAFAPATHVAHFRISLPAKTEREALQTALYAVEDELGQPAEEVHVTLGPRLSGTRERDIYIIDRNLLADWKNALATLEIEADVICPEQSLFDVSDCPVSLSGYTLTAHNGRIFGVETELVQNSNSGLGYHTLYTDVNPENHLIRLAERSASSPNINFLSGAFASRRKPPNNFNVWRMAAGIAIAAASIWVGTVILETRNYNYSINQSRSAAAEKFSKIFPNTPLPTDIDRATRDMLANAPSADDFSFREITALVYEGILQTGQSQLSNLDYDKSENRLAFNLITSSPETAALVKTHIERTGLKVQMTTSESGSEFEAKLVVEKP